MRPIRLLREVLHIYFKFSKQSFIMLRVVCFPFDFPFLVFDKFSKKRIELFFIEGDPITFLCPWLLRARCARRDNRYALRVIDSQFCDRWLFIAITRAGLHKGSRTAFHRKRRTGDASGLVWNSLRALDPLRSRLKPRPSPNRSMDIDHSPFWMMA